MTGLAHDSSHDLGEAETVMKGSLLQVSGYLLCHAGTDRHAPFVGAGNE